jgi:hypothetical protein
MKHNHQHDHCKHEHLKYCAHCQKPFCLDCGQEWNLYGYQYMYMPTGPHDWNLSTMPHSGTGPYTLTTSAPQTNTPMCSHEN